jgi:hypothetical protein
MRAAWLVLLLLGCRTEATIRAEPTPPRVRAGTVVETPLVGWHYSAYYEVPKHVARRKTWAAFPLSTTEHGLDGALELWREERVDDALVAKTWGAYSYESFATWAPDRSGWPISAQLVIKDPTGKIVASEDLHEPSAKIALVTFDEPYFEVSVDTAVGAVGTTHRFVRVVGGEARWLDCATSTRSATKGYDLEAGAIVRWERRNGVTTKQRINVAEGTCRVSADVF